MEESDQVILRTSIRERLMLAVGPEASDETNDIRQYYKDLDRDDSTEEEDDEYGQDEVD